MPKVDDVLAGSSEVFPWVLCTAGWQGIDRSNLGRLILTDAM